MSFKELLGYKLIETGDYFLSVYHLIVAVVVVIIARVVLILIGKVFRRQVNRNRLDIGKSHSIYQILKYVIWITAILLVLDTVGIKITFLLASSAALLVGLGLGLQQIFQDFLSGITLLIEGTLKVGDIVETRDGEVGMVKEMNLRTSKLETRDNIILIVPNSKLINDVVINWSHMDKTTRFSIKVGVAYGSDVEKVTKILLDCAKSHKDVVDKPKPLVFFKDFGSSSLDFELLFYTNKTFRVEVVKSDLRYRIDQQFREQNITIPFPQRDVHFYRE